MRIPQLKMKLSLRGMMLLVALAAISLWGIGVNSRYRLCMDLAEECRANARGNRAAANTVQRQINQGNLTSFKYGPNDKRTPQEVLRDMEARRRHYTHRAILYERLSFRYNLAAHMPFLPMPTPPPLSELEPR